MHAYIHTHTYIKTYIHTYTNTHTYIHTHIHTYTHTHTYIHTYIHGRRSCDHVSALSLYRLPRVELAIEMRPRRMQLSRETESRASPTHAPPQPACLPACIIMRRYRSRRERWLDAAFITNQLILNPSNIVIKKENLRIIF